MCVNVSQEHFITVDKIWMLKTRPAAAEAHLLYILSFVQFMDILWFQSLFSH